MPKLAPTQFQIDSGIVRANIRSRGAYFNCCTDKAIAKKIGMAYSTYLYRKNNPTSWVLEELIQAAVALKVPLVWLMTDHSVV
ncbi:MAG: hypothetical protein K2N36_07220 [Ruminiclostridium sp.]|nr:hypothetical protein [Ruminiclostridium sp.]